MVSTISTHKVTIDVAETEEIEKAKRKIIKLNNKLSETEVNLKHYKEKSKSL